MPEISIKDYRESVYRTPRTYGNATGYDREFSHAFSVEAKLANELLLNMAHGGTAIGPAAVTHSFVMAHEFVRQAYERGLVLEVQDAPGMKQDYGTTRGKP